MLKLVAFLAPCAPEELVVRIDFPGDIDASNRGKKKRRGYLMPSNCSRNLVYSSGKARTCCVRFQLCSCAAGRHWTDPETFVPILAQIRVQGPSYLREALVECATPVSLTAAVRPAGRTGPWQWAMASIHLQRRTDSYGGSDAHVNP